jgi:thiamine-monophosphate kinase
VRGEADGLLLTVDVLVEGVDFDFAYCSGADAGWKALVASVSDIAAMGGTARRAVVGLLLPAQTSLGVAEGIADGVTEAAEHYRVNVVGGDVSSASEVGLAVSMTGALEDGPVTRGGAKAGELLCVTGELGGAAAGLAALRAGRGTDFEDASRRQLRPQARAKEGTALARTGATAMIDLSDGLAPDLGHLAEASGVGCEIEVDAIPMEPQALEVAAALSLDPFELAVAGGEDFELLVALPENAVPEARAALDDLGTKLTVLGRLRPGSSAIGGRSLDQWKEKSWEHLRNK